MSIWYNIYNNINDPSIKLVGLFIGSSMEYYDKVTEENNQQYPCFLNKFNGKKLIILVDPHLELELKIEEYFIKKGYPLVCTNKILNDDKPVIRIFNNDQVTVYALNESINYTKHQWVDKEDQPDTHKIYALINLCLDNKKKFILQDFSGNDTTYFYSYLLKKYNRQELLHHINMDVTQNDSGCRFKLYQDLINLDRNGNFIQEKFMELSKIKESILFNTILKFRINMFIYPICYYYEQLIKNIEIELESLQFFQIGLISTIYNVDFDEDSRDFSYIVEKLGVLITIILKDIISARELEESFYNYIMTNIHNRSILYETMKVLNFE